MHICLDSQTVNTIRGAARTAAQLNNTLALHVDLFMAFAREQVLEVERMLDDGDFARFLSAVLKGWDRRYPDQVFELLSRCLGTLGIVLDVEVGESDVMQDVRLRDPAQGGKTARARHN